MENELFQFLSRLGDYSLQSIRWLEDEEGGLELVLLPPSDLGELGPLRLEFSWVTSLRVGFDFGFYSGAPLVFESSVQRTPGGSLSFLLRFGAAPNGEIAFECNAVKMLQGDRCEIL